MRDSISPVASWCAPSMPTRSSTPTGCGDWCDRSSVLETSSVPVPPSGWPTAARSCRAGWPPSAVPTGLWPGSKRSSTYGPFCSGVPGWNRLGGNLLISGAFGLFRRQNLLDTNGYIKTVGEDMELVVRLRRAAYEKGEKGAVQIRARPGGVDGDADEVRGWAVGGNVGRGASRTPCAATSPRDVQPEVRRPRNGRVSCLRPLRMDGRQVEVTGIFIVVLGVILGDLSPLFAVLFFCLACGLGVLLSMLALLLEELSFRRYGRVLDRALLVVWAALENLGYRQLTVWWRLRGIVSYIRGKRSWGKMTRKGFNSVDDEEAEEDYGSVPVAA